MGRCSSKSAIEVGSSTSMGLLSGDIKRLKDSWSEIEGKSELAQIIFKDAFAIAPKIKDIFGFTTPDEDLHSDERFIQHTKTFGGFLDSVVTSMPDEKIVLIKARKIGVQHAHMVTLTGSQFKPEYWNVLTECAVKAIGRNLGSRGGGRTEATWHQFLFRIVLEMQVCFYKEQVKLQDPSSANALAMTNEEL